MIHKQSIYKATTLATSSLLVASLAGIANADPTPSSKIESLDELVVTGDLWKSPLQKTPSSVTVIDLDERKIGDVQNFGDLINQIPNLTGTSGSSRFRYFQIRGIGENSQYDGEVPDSSVRFVIDDIDFTGLGGAASTFDVSQAEVLRGPQAGAFGANAVGGLVRLVSNAPTPFWSGMAEASIGNDNLRRGGFAIGGPLLERNPEELMFRFSLEHSESDGFIKNRIYNRHTNSVDEWFSRARVIWNPQPDLKFDSTFFYSNQDNGFDVFALDNNGKYTYSDEPGRDEQESIGGSIRSSFDGWDNIEFSSVTSFAYTDSLYSYDEDWTDSSYQGFLEVDRTRKVFTQEIRFDSAENAERLGILDRWTLGAYFSYRDEDGDATSTTRSKIPTRVRSLHTTYENRNFALFGQGATELDNDAGRIILGLRAEHVNVRGSGLSLQNGAPYGSHYIHSDTNDLMFGGKLSYEYDLTPSAIAFASITHGYKSGGINHDARINVGGNFPFTYDTERLWNYELGIRGTTFNDRLQGSIVAFYTDRRNFQTTHSDGVGGDYRYAITNGGRGSLIGLEADARLAITDDWSLYGSLGLLRSDSKAAIFGNGTVWNGGRLPNAPSYNYSAGISYRPESGIFANFELLGSDSYLESSSHTERRSSFNIANASIGYRHENWTATLWSKNLFDTRYDDRVFFFGNEEPNYVPTRYTSRANPRTFGVTVRYEF